MALTKEKYMIAGIITLIVFFLGIFMGFMLEQKRFDYSQRVNNGQKVELSSLQLQLAYINQLSQEKDCDKLTRTFDTTLENLGNIQERVERFYEDAQITKTDFELLRREYMISQINFWIFTKTVKDTCATNHTRILYFYSTEEQCTDCGNQEFVLNYLKKVYKEKLLIFSIDATRDDEKMISLLKTIYDVDTYPTLIVEDEKMEGFVSKDDLQDKICSFHASDFVGCNDDTSITDSAEVS